MIIFFPTLSAMRIFGMQQRAVLTMAAPFIGPPNQKSTLGGIPFPA